MQNIEHPFPKGTPLPKRHAVYPCPFILSFVRIWCCFEESIAVEERNKGTLGVDFDLRLAAHCIADHGLFSDFDQFSPLLPLLLHHSFFLLLSVLSMFPSLFRLSRCSEPSRNPLLLDVGATENGRAHVITDGLAGAEQEMMPLLGFLAKSRREAEFPTEILM